MGMHPRPSHREMCPEQYSHPLAGQYVRLVLPGTAKEITTLVERVYANGRGVHEIVVLDTNGGQHFYPIENVRGIAKLKHFWISWVQPTEDYRPINYPPLPARLPTAKQNGVPMKRLLLLLLLTSSAHAQSITVTRGEWSRTIPNADFAALEKAIEQDGQPGDHVHIVGTFTGGRLDMLDLTKIAGGELTGDGPDKSRLIFTAQHDRIGPEDNPEKMAGPALLLPNSGSIRIAGLYLENTPENVHEDGALAGWPGAWTGTSEATFEDCEVKAHDWGLVYDWSLRSNRTVNLRRINGVAARSFIALMHAASSYTLNMENCDISIDGNLSVSYGESSAADPVTGGVMTPVILRAGTGKATGCTFSVKGMTPAQGFPVKWTPTRIVAVATDQYYSKGAANTQMTLKGCKVLGIDPGVAKVLKVDDFRWGQQPVWDR